MTEDSEESPDDVDLELLRELRNEARETVDQQIDTSDDIDTKASRILRLNVLLISALLTVVSLSVRADFLSANDVLNPYSAIGIACLIFSTGFAGLTYTASDLEVGIAYQEVRELLDSDASLRNYREELVYGYANWMEFNDKTNIRNAPLITTTILFVIYAVSFLTIGVAEAVTDSGFPPIVLLGTVAMLLILTYFSGIVEQSRRWYSVAKPIRTARRKVRNVVAWVGSKLR